MAKTNKIELDTTENIFKIWPTRLKLENFFPPLDLTAEEKEVSPLQVHDFLAELDNGHVYPIENREHVVYIECRLDYGLIFLALDEDFILENLHVFHKHFPNRDVNKQMFLMGIVPFRFAAEHRDILETMEGRVYKKSKRSNLFSVAFSPSKNHFDFGYDDYQLPEKIFKNMTYNPLNNEPGADIEL